MMKLQLGEHEAVKHVLAYAARYGYGNLIAHLQTAWARRMMEDGASEKTARLVGGLGYPFGMWKDIIENGEWDETGEKYR